MATVPHRSILRPTPHNMRETVSTPRHQTPTSNTTTSVAAANTSNATIDYSTASTSRTASRPVTNASKHGLFRIYDDDDDDVHTRQYVGLAPEDNGGIQYSAVPTNDQPTPVIVYEGLPSQPKDRAHTTVARTYHDAVPVRPLAATFSGGHSVKARQIQRLPVKGMNNTFI